MEVDTRGYDTTSLIVMSLLPSVKLQKTSIIYWRTDSNPPLLPCVCVCMCVSRCSCVCAVKGGICMDIDNGQQYHKTWPSKDLAWRRLTESGETGLEGDWKGCIIIGDQLRTSSGHSARLVSGGFCQRHRERSCCPRHS